MYTINYVRSNKLLENYLHYLDESQGEETGRYEAFMVMMIFWVVMPHGTNVSEIQYVPNDFTRHH
jgi:hypothetical protein